MIKKREVTLHRYSSKRSIGYDLPTHQLEFTRLPIEIIEKDANDPLKHFIIIKARGEDAGFFELDESEDRKKYSNNPKALLLRGFSVNPKYQGRGIATGSIYALPEFMEMEFPDFDQVVLGVNARNIPAQRLYQKAGFEDTGRRIMRSKGEQLVMSLYTNKAK
ncbi:GNAT family N-acetyltransferase [Planococcus sp. ANT_H30]|uniref:GNAT family acetyltransferase n=1 Tax=Planococcus kocurii TaxID=1374 RepID=A0ABM5WTJ9_9BACL|nr:MULTISPECIES: GNAT family N-acetyltransferase [Planococcus]ALS77578.1 GNAT family acetyltransferase [Planococcus kocurii]KAA0959039.1 GNAT family N-acetyltransferase [Planococcus sp. ANT_H30]